MLASLIHGAVTPSHLQEWWGYGLFFAAATSAQFLLGAFLWLRYLEARASLNDPYPSVTGGNPAFERATYMAGILGNLAIALLYVITRTVGIPFFGPEAGEVEAWDFLGVSASAAEVALAAFLGYMRRRAVRRQGDWR
jgi:hypothetical protein